MPETKKIGGTHPSRFSVFAHGFFINFSENYSRFLYDKIMVPELGEAYTGLITSEGLKFIHEASKPPLHVPHAPHTPQPHTKAEPTHTIEHIIHATFDAQGNQLSDPVQERDFTRVPSVERPHFPAKPKEENTAAFVDHSPRHFGAKYSPKELQRMEIRHNKSKRHDKGHPGLERNGFMYDEGYVIKHKVDRKNLHTLMKDPFEEHPTAIHEKKQKQRPVKWQRAQKNIANITELRPPMRNQVAYGKADYRRPNHQHPKDELWSKNVTYFGRDRFR